MQPVGLDAKHMAAVKTQNELPKHGKFIRPNRKNRKVLFINCLVRNVAWNCKSIRKTKNNGMLRHALGGTVSFFLAAFYFSLLEVNGLFVCPSCCLLPACVPYIGGRQLGKNLHVLLETNILLLVF